MGMRKRNWRTWGMKGTTFLPNWEVAARAVVMNSTPKRRESVGIITPVREEDKGRARKEGRAGGPFMCRLWPRVDRRN